MVAAITPFNFPLNLIAHKLGPAIAAGCPVVCKPAERTPLSAVALAERFSKPGCRPGGSRSDRGRRRRSAARWPATPDVAAVSFTGSAAVGTRLARDAAHAEVLLELGSAAPLVAEADADVDAVVDAWSRAGSATPASRACPCSACWSTRSIADAVARPLAARVAALRVGATARRGQRPVLRDRCRGG